MLKVVIPSHSLSNLTNIMYVDSSSVRAEVPWSENDTLNKFWTWSAVKYNAENG